MEKVCDNCGARYLLHGDPACPMPVAIRISKWAHLCQRCGDFGDARSQLLKQLCDLGSTLIKTRTKAVKTEFDTASMNTIIASMRALIEALCKKFCEYHGIQFIKDEILSETIVHHPERTYECLKSYETTIKQMAGKPASAPGIPERRNRK